MKGLAAAVAKLSFGHRLSEWFIPECGVKVHFPAHLP